MKSVLFYICLGLLVTLPLVAQESLPDETVLPASCVPTDAFQQGERMEIKNAGLFVTLPSGWGLKKAQGNSVALGPVDRPDSLILIKLYPFPLFETLPDVSEHLACDIEASGIVRALGSQLIAIDDRNAFVYHIQTELLNGQKTEVIKAYPDPQRRIGIEVTFDLPLDRAFILEFLQSVRYINIPQPSIETVIGATYQPPEGLSRQDTLVENRAQWSAGADPINPDIMLVADLLRRPVPISAGEAFRSLLDGVLQTTGLDERINVTSARAMDDVIIEGCETSGAVIGLNTSMTVVLFVAVPKNSNVAHAFRAYLDGDGKNRQADIITSFRSVRSRFSGLINQDDVNRFVEAVKQSEKDKTETTEPVADADSDAKDRTPLLPEAPILEDQKPIPSSQKPPVSDELPPVEQDIDF
ncbi:MAG: hypothetical protein ABIH86_01285 [Planctomycetota bacterium]